VALSRVSSADDGKNAVARKCGGSFHQLFSNHLTAGNAKTSGMIVLQK
jgi:hypothetical protein